MEEPLIDPSKVSILVAGGMGAFLSVLFQRNSSKLMIFTTLATAEVVDYYCAKPTWVLMHSSFHWADDQWQGPVALTIGLLAIFVVGGITKIASDFWDSPWNTVADFLANVVERFIPGKRGK